MLICCCWGSFTGRGHLFANGCRVPRILGIEKPLYSEVALLGPSEIFLVTHSHGASGGEGVDTLQRGSFREHLSACAPLSHVRDVFEEGCHVNPVRACEMSLSLWPKKCFGAVLVRDPALKQHPEVSWRRQTHHICAAELFVIWVKTPSCSCCVLLSCLGAALQSCWTRVLLRQAWLQAPVCNTPSSPRLSLLTVR